MKCEYCGANLQIEDAYCPNCGRENPHYRQHRADMEAYREDYLSTKDEVLENAARISRRTVRITVIAVLVALCAAAFVACLMSYEIQSARIERDISRNRAAYETRLQDYMQAVDPAGLYKYASSNRLTYSRGLEEYDRVFSISMHYSFFYERLAELIAEDESVRYESVEETCETLAKYAGYIYEDTEKRSYDKDSCFTEDKTAYMNAAVEKMGVLLQAYFGLTEEEVSQIPELSTARLAIMLEEGYAHED